LSKRVLLIVGGVILVIVLAIAGGLLYFINSAGFQERARQYIIQQIQENTGGVATLDKFRWSIWDQRFILEGLTIRGLEPPTDPPLAHIQSVLVGVKLRSLFQHRIDLFELIVNRPAFRLLVDENGKTNLPNPPARERKNLDFQFSIGDFRIVEGSALINERREKVDLALSNVMSTLRYATVTRILSSDLKYDGTLSLEGHSAIPYTLSGNFDYTRGTIVAHHIDVKSGKSAIMLQGRIDDVLTKDLLGKLEYSGVAAVPFLNYFFPKEKLSGSSDVVGTLEFARGYVLTHGTAVAESITFDDWNARKFRGEYSYHYPSRRLVLHRMTTRVLDGTASGDIAVEPLPGEARVTLDLDYTDVDAAQLARVYPWDPQYRIYSRLTGELHGWFEGRFERFELAGNAGFRSYMTQPNAGIVPLPLDGFTDYEAVPNRVRVQNAAIHLGSTDINADGLIDKDNADLKVKLASTNLADMSFIYKEANGTGSFDGALTGPIKTPLFDGQFDITNHKHGEWTIQHAAGGIRLDTLAQVADLREVHVTQGQSEAIVSGTTTLDGTKVNLQARARNVRSEDIAPFAARVTNRQFTGVFSASAHITSLDPLQFDDDLRAENLVVDGQRVGNVTASVRYREPLLELQRMNLSDNGATLVGNVSYNRMTEAMTFDVSIANSMNFDRLRTIGLPMDLQGVIQRARFTGSGTLSQPRINGDAELTNLTFHGETFPQANLHLETAGTSVRATLTTPRNINLTADIDTSRNGYPFNATVSFSNYSIERLMGFSQGSVTVTGQADLKGQLQNSAQITGEGKINQAQISVQNRTYKPTAPFTFSFTPDRLTLSDVSLAGPQGERATVSGTVALTKEAAMNFEVTDAVLDLSILPALLRSEDSSLELAGGVTINGRISGTPQKPELSGTARLNNASLSKKGLLVNLSGMNGAISFNGNRFTLDDVTGKVSNGTVRMQGIGTIQGFQVQTMNIQIDPQDVRIRYPEGLRTLLGGSLVLRGSWNAPVLEGNLQIQSMAYRGAFEDFLALFQSTDSFQGQTSEFGRLGLAIHVEGSRNISIQNELADVEARVDLDIKGTVDHPALTGHVEASGGTLTFQGRRYQITRGNMDFVDPLRIEPVIDVQAETELREYHVIVNVTGRGDRVRANLRSDPPLPELEIFSLISGGKTREELANQAGPGGRIPTSEELFQGGAASVFSDMLKSRVVPNRFGLLGLERIRIDPLLNGPANKPSARVTVPLQVTKDLSITYSQDLVTNTEVIVQVEYFFKKNMSILATRDENATLGLDLRLRKRY